MRRSCSCEPVVSANSLVGVICLVLGCYRRRMEHPRLYKFSGDLSAMRVCVPWISFSVISIPLDQIGLGIYVGYSFVSSYVNVQIGCWLLWLCLMLVYFGTNSKLDNC